MIEFSLGILKQEVITGLYFTNLFSMVYSALRNLLLSLFFFNFLLVVSCKRESITKGGGGSLQISGLSKSVGVANDLITIYGAGFDAKPQANTVQLSGQPMTVVDGNTKQLRVLVPSSATTGRINISSQGQTAQSDSTFAVAVLVQGNQTTDQAWTADNTYLLRGKVVFTAATKLSIAPGTRIFGEKASRGSLQIGNYGVLAAMAPTTLFCSGTPTNPIVFTSDQPIGSRLPGDWGGITLNSQIRNLAPQGKGASGSFEYVRIEFAGYVDPYKVPANGPDDIGAGIKIIGLNDDFNDINHVQVSYSAGDAFYLQDGSIGLKYLIAFRCEGNDFRFDGFSTNNVQFCLGLKDPYKTALSGSDGVLVTNHISILRSTQTAFPATPDQLIGPALSNMTLVGGNTSARNISRRIGNLYLDSSVTAVNGSGVHVKADNKPGNLEHLVLINSLVVGSLKAGVSFDGDRVWQAYNAATDQRSILSRNVFTGVAAQSLPVSGGALGFEASSASGSYFKSIPAADVSKYLDFRKDNISYNSNYQTNFYVGPARIPNCPDNNVNPNGGCPISNVTLAAKDNLSIKNSVSFSQLSNPVLLPGSDSPLIGATPLRQVAFGLSAPFAYGPSFSGITRTSDFPFFEQVTFIGAFGSNDWARPWASFDPGNQIY